MNDDINRILEGRNCGLIDVKSSKLLGETVENHTNPESGYPVSQVRFELNISRT
jgi:hypothetical protein